MSFLGSNETDHTDPDFAGKTAIGSAAETGTVGELPIRGRNIPASKPSESIAAAMPAITNRLRIRRCFISSWHTVGSSSDDVRIRVQAYSSTSATSDAD